MVAIIGGEPRRFRPLVDLYREAGAAAGYSPEQLKVGVHALGYVAPTTRAGGRRVLPRLRHARSPTSARSAAGGRSRAPTSTRSARRTGALIVGEPGRGGREGPACTDEALGGISRLTFQMNAASLPHAKLMQAIELIGNRVAPAVRKELALGPAPVIASPNRPAADRRSGAGGDSRPDK